MSCRMAGRVMRLLEKSYTRTVVAWKRCCNCRNRLVEERMLGLDTLKRRRLLA
jgi:hypothetical protein